jgi:hypothetical protein
MQPFVEFMDELIGRLGLGVEQVDQLKSLPELKDPA